MYEVACEPSGKCNVDQRSFKAYLSRWMGSTMQMAPFTADFIMPKLKASAVAAAQQCTGGATKDVCGIKWNIGANDGTPGGFGEQMCALSVIQANLIPQAQSIVTTTSGGTSKGDAAAGGGGSTTPQGLQDKKVTTGDRVGAGFLTTLMIVGVLGGAWWMIA